MRRRVIGGMAGLLFFGLLAAMPALAGASPVWSLDSSPNNGAMNNTLYDVSCKTASSCKAVGFYMYSSGDARTLVESWNGSAWSIASSPNPSQPSNGIANGILNGVSCPSTTSCKAVGSYIQATPTTDLTRTLVESWNGSSWSVSSSPSNGTGANSLNAVSCLSSSFCFAVGDFITASSVERTLIETWNGSSWSLVTSPNHGSAGNFLNGISCSAANSCEAVGGYDTSTGTLQTLAESWNGSTWSLATSANNGTGNNHLNSVSCVSNSSCQSVSYYVTSASADKTLAESWNGSTWLLESSPNQGTGNDGLNGVSCKSGSCAAVGTYFNGSSIKRSLAESWNGTSWSIVMSPNNGVKDNDLYRVSCVSATSCTAVGYFLNSTGVQRTLIESFG